MNKRIKELRNQLNLNQTEFARSLDVTPAAISKIEAGTRPLTDRMIHNICTEFGVDEHWLRTGEGDMFPLPPDEDVELIEAFGLIGGDDMDPVRKRLARAVIELLIELPDEAIPAVRKFIDASAKAFGEQEKDEE